MIRFPAVLGLLLTLASSLLAAEEPLPLLHPLFGDHCVLQRGAAVAVWGWSAPGALVAIGLEGPGAPAATASATAGADGKWLARIGPLAAGGPWTLRAVSGARRSASSDVLVGDVWLCGGQSNMAYPVTHAKDPAQEKAAATWPQIRHLAVDNTIAGRPQSLFKAAWQVCSPATVGAFSATGYFFGRQLHRDLRIPIGLVTSAYGGTRAECWVSPGALTAALPELAGPVAAFQDLVRRSEAERAQTGKSYEELARAWYQANDPGSAGDPAAWSVAAVDPAGWVDVTLPNQLKKAKAVPPGFTGTLWLRREFDLPAELAGLGGVLYLIRVKDMNAAWINGRSIGDSESVNWQRKHRVPPGLLVAGRNVLAIRLVNLEGECGLTGKAEELAFTPDGRPPVPLAGTWRLRLATDFAKAPPMPARYDRTPAITSLSHGMIEPLLPMTMTGVAFFHGSSNTDAAWQYRRLLPALIADWRARFGRPELPFLIVQLANHMERSETPARTSAWAELREAQAMTAASVPGTGLVVTIDIGDAKDIHFPNKQEVGRRLGLLAESQVYGLAVAGSGPRCTGVTADGPRLRIAFAATGDLASADGGPLTGFSVAGEDRRFVWAEARIEGATVVVGATAVARPVAVRYAWANNPACNLTDASRLPAGPFRSDDWPGITWPKTDR